MISKHVIENKTKLTQLFHNSSDLVFYELETLANNHALIVYIDGLIDKRALNEFVIMPLLNNDISPKEIKSSIYLAEIKEIFKLKEVISELVNGHVVLFNEDIDYAYVLKLCQYEKRSVNESSTEQVIKGPKEAFVEDLFTNKTLIRRIIRNRNLVFEDFVFGKQTNTQVSIVYINGIVNQDILAELKARLHKINIDAILDVHYIEEYLDDAPKSLIRTVYNTEKPDVLAGKILEGRIGVLCDGSPNAITLPKIFIEDIMTPEDYYLKPLFGTYLRIIRFIAFFISILLVGVYISLVNYHQEMIPTPLLISLAGQREGVPFPSFLEGLIMIFFFEIMKEAGLRLPKPIGQTVTLIGGLVIGQAAVEAGLVSAIMVIIVSASGISEFVNPSFRDLIVMYRMIFIILGGLFGLFGIVCGFIIMTFHLISLKSFGVPYLFPIAPYDKEGMRDFLRREPLKKLNYRPKYIADKESRRRNK
ncbi:spore germination protein [Tissierella sp. Yu-01]|uniref:spore germination protein n=1 Tax=Tissierella sp. Yu-01 TaxID=3035694 RepID=UPI00240E1837|nr:spore germination protein [Tissierella sp. Yu-01]WFA09926.1 spore germination protein [Tissierella sp. Yu-01]